MAQVENITSMDVGGTFTDILCVGTDGTIKPHKISNLEPDNLKKFLKSAGGDAATFLYSTTAIVNAVLTGKLQNVGLIVNKGFRDLLETARLPVSVGVEPGNQLPRRLIPLEYVREIDARVDHSGVEIKQVSAKEVSQLVDEFKQLGVNSVVISLLHSYAYPEHEQNVRAIIKEVSRDFDITLSSDVLSESREYERTLSAALTSLLRPIMDRHLCFFPDNHLAELSDLWLMQSNGGVAPAQSAIENPLASTMSGPVAAVIGMNWINRQCGVANAITFDVGGTSTDVALITEGVVQKKSVSDIGNFSLKLSSLDVLSIGAGGGSLAFMAQDKRWHVGPESAGALPGPVCYARGGVQPTLTDANLLLGRIPESLLGGKLSLDKQAAFDALEKLGKKRNLDAIQAAKDVLRLASHNMCGAIRRVSVLKGYAPSDYVLCGMGGAGPMHAAEVAELLGMSSVFIPLDPGITAAWGVYVADIEQDFSQAIGMLDQNISYSKISRGFSKLIERAKDWASKHQVALENCQFNRKLDLRYKGMTHESTVACHSGADNKIEELIDGTFDTFHSQFEEMTGRVWRDKEAVEIVNLRISLVSNRTKKLANLPTYHCDGADPLLGHREVAFLHCEALLDTPIYNRKSLSGDAKIDGPAIIEQDDTTIVLPPRWTAKIDDYGNLFITLT